MCVSGGKKCYFFRKFCVRTKWIIPRLSGRSFLLCKSNEQKITLCKISWFQSCSSPFQNNFCHGSVLSSFRKAKHKKCIFFSIAFSQMSLFRGILVLYFGRETSFCDILISRISEFNRKIFLLQSTLFFTSWSF